MVVPHSADNAAFLIFVSNSHQLEDMRLIICILLSLSFSSLQGQDRGTLRQNAEPAFVRSYQNYLRVNERRAIDGYRVQIFNGNRRDANDKRSEVLRAFPDMLSMVIFETPDYKLQVGNYRTIYEAEGALVIIREKYPQAFVVQTQIDLPELQLPKPDEDDDNEVPERTLPAQRNEAPSEELNRRN